MKKAAFAPSPRACTRSPWWWKAAIVPGWIKTVRQQADRGLYDHVSAVTVQFAKSYVDVPGMLYMLLQRVTLQNINLIEIASTYTEIMMFIDEADTRTIFDTLFQSFLVKSGGERYY